MARIMQPWASAISQPRGRATSMSASHSVNAVVSSSSMISCKVASVASREPGSAGSVPRRGSGRPRPGGCCCSTSLPDRPMLWPLLIGAWKRKQLL